MNKYKSQVVFEDLKHLEYKNKFSNMIVEL